MIAMEALDYSNEIDYTSASHMNSAHHCEKGMYLFLTYPRFVARAPGNKKKANRLT